MCPLLLFFFFQAEDGIRDLTVTGVQTCAFPIWIFRGFGVEVVELIRREELLYGFDDDIRVALAQEMRGRGVEIHARTQVARIEKEPHGYSVYTTMGQEFSVDLVMYATGRNPN